MSSVSFTNLGDCSEEAIRGLFSDGKISKIEQKDQRTVVFFIDDASAESALMLNNTEQLGRVISALKTHDSDSDDMILLSDSDSEGVDLGSSSIIKSAKSEMMIPPRKQLPEDDPFALVMQWKGYIALGTLSFTLIHSLVCS